MPATPLIPPNVEDDVKKMYSWGEIAKHNSLLDCWIVVEGKVYDVTQWVASHPGGDIIGIGAGRESTALVYSYHPTTVFPVLKKYYIGDVANYENYYTFQSPFYSTMKQRVAAHMKEKGLTRSSSVMYAKSAALLALWVVFYNIGIIKGYWVAAIILGFIHGELGINIMHDGNHGAYSENKYLCWLAGITMDLMGASRVVWWHQHNVGHHPNSNNTQAQKSPPNKMDPLAFDPDASAGNPWLRLNPSQQHWWLHKYQHIYMWFVIMFVNFKWYINDIRSMLRRRYMDIDFVATRPGELFSLFFTKFLYLFYMLSIPVYFHGGAYGVFLFILANVTMSYTFVLMFGVNHLTEECTFPDGDLAYDKRDWAVLQVMTASNFASDSPLWTHISGGLNYQIEHHLFPGVNHTHLSTISPIVRQTCKEFGVPYTSFPSFWSAIYSYYAHLKALGNPTTTFDVTKKVK